MALPLASIALFAGVVLSAGAVTAGGISFTADTVARMAAAAPMRVQPPRVSYGVSLPVVKAEDLNIASSWPAATAQPAPAQQVSEAQATVKQVAVEQVAQVAPAPDGPSGPGAFVLENGKWVQIDGAVKGWMRNGDGSWVYADLSAQ